jgi:hypothetical protein
MTKLTRRLLRLIFISRFDGNRRLGLVRSQRES